jgi:hypothetical protein
VVKAKETSSSLAQVQTAPFLTGDAGRDVVVGSAKPETDQELLPEGDRHHRMRADFLGVPVDVVASNRSFDLVKLLRKKRIARGESSSCSSEELSVEHVDIRRDERFFHSDSEEGLDTSSDEEGETKSSTYSSHIVSLAGKSSSSGTLVKQTDSSPDDACSSPDSWLSQTGAFSSMRRSSSSDSQELCQSKSSSSSSYVAGGEWKSVPLSSLCSLVSSEELTAETSFRKISLRQPVNLSAVVRAAAEEWRDLETVDNPAQYSRHLQLRAEDQAEE